MEGALVAFPAPPETARLLRVVAEAEHRNRADTDRGMESRRWLHPDEDGAADIGLPRTVLGPQDAREQIPMRDFTAQRHPERLPAQDFETDPVIALLTTEHDRRTDWLRAGQALERVLLEATLSGVSASFLNQPLEHRELRWLVRHPLTGVGQPHMLMRLGYGEDVPLTPRRPVSEVRRPPRTDL